MPSELFEAIARLGKKRPKREQFFLKASQSDLSRLLQDLRGALPRAGRPTSPFAFVANSQLSGLPDPCHWIDCRIEHADSLARFAALYADDVVIRDPFERHHGREKFDFDDRFDLMSSVEVLLHLKPVLDRGLVSIAESPVHFCSSCLKEASGKNDPWLRRMSKLGTHLEKKYTQAIRATIRQGDDYGYQIMLKGPSEFIEHGTSLTDFEEIPNGVPPPKGRKPVRLTVDQIRQSGVVRERIVPIVEDLTIQNWHANLFGRQYISDRELDMELIQQINSETTRNRGKAIMDALTHSVPCVTGASISQMVELRLNEAEAFQVYRDAVLSAIRTIEKETPKKPKEAFGDIVQPELNKIDLAVRNARRLVKRSMAAEIMIGTAIVAVGLFSGLLPHNIGPLVAALGGGQRALSLSQRAGELATDPKEARDNKYYFLWKIRQARRKRA